MGRDRELESLAERLGSGLVTGSNVGWGDARATSRLVLSDGRILAARRFLGATAQADARRVDAVMGRLADSGIPVPRAAVIEDRGERVAWLTTPWIEGDTGAAWLDAAGSREEGDEERLRALALCQLLDRGATTSDAAGRERWLALLADAMVEWGIAGTGAMARPGTDPQAT